MTPRSPAAPSPFSRTCSWKSDFLQSLVLRDKREKSYDEFISACPPSPSLVLIPHISIPLHPLSTKQTNGSTDSRLALRTTSLASATSSTETAVGEPGSDTTETGGGLNITQLKADLTAAQQSKTQLQSRIKALSEEVSTLQQKQEQFDKVTTERSKLDRRTKDLEEEVRAKNKHVQVVISRELSGPQTLLVLKFG